MPRREDAEASDHLWKNKGMERRAFPEKIETKRLMLRRYESEDAAGLLKLVEANREQLIREFVQVANLRESLQGRFFLEEKQEQWQNGKTYCYGIWRRGEKRQIGQIQVKNIAWEIPSAELSYFIARQWQRQGYACESIAAILRMAFAQLKFERIFVRILPVNEESYSLAKKMGFQEEGLHRKAFRCGFGELHDVRNLSIVAEGYRKLMQ